MTQVIQISKDFWIEVFSVARRTIPAGTSQSIGFTLSKPGHCVAAFCSLDATGGNTTDLTISIRNAIANAYITYGVSLGSIFIALTNSDITSRVLGGHGTVFMTP